MVLLDSNLFIVDRFFPRDSVYPQNRLFMDQVGSIEAGISVITLLEVCGVAAFRLTTRELESWLFRFFTIYPVHVLDVHGVTGKEPDVWWNTFVAEVSGNISKKMTFGDALLLREAEKYAVDAIITWNTKDFSRRTRLPVHTPSAFLKGIETRT